MNEFFTRSLRLGGSLCLFALAVALDLGVFMANYMMTERALGLFFEQMPIGTDALLGPVFLSLGVPQATLSQFVAFILSLLSLVVVGYLWHEFQQDRSQAEGRIPATVKVVLAIALPLLLFDLALFEMRFAMLLFDQYAELGDLPTPTRLLGEHPAEFRTWLLVASALFYPAVILLAAGLTQISLAGLRENFEEWLDLWWPQPKQEGQERQRGSEKEEKMEGRPKQEDQERQRGVALPGAGAQSPQATDATGRETVRQSEQPGRQTIRPAASPLLPSPSSSGGSSTRPVLEPLFSEEAHCPPTSFPPNPPLSAATPDATATPFPPSESPSVNGPEEAEKGTFRGTYQACSRCGVIFFGEEIEEHGCAAEVK